MSAAYQHPQRSIGQLHNLRFIGAAIRIIGVSDPCEALAAVTGAIHVGETFIRQIVVFGEFIAPQRAAGKPFSGGENDRLIHHHTVRKAPRLSEYGLGRIRILANRGPDTCASVKIGVTL